MCWVVTAELLYLELHLIIENKRDYIVLSWQKYKALGERLNILHYKQVDFALHDVYFSFCECFASAKSGENEILCRLLHSGST